MTGVKYCSQGIIKIYIMSNNKEQQWYEEIFPCWCAHDIINEVIQMLWKKSIPLSLVFLMYLKQVLCLSLLFWNQTPLNIFQRKIFLIFFKVLNCSVNCVKINDQKNIYSVQLERIIKKGQFYYINVLKCFWYLFRLMSCLKKVQYLSQKHQS